MRRNLSRRQFTALSGAAAASFVLSGCIGTNRATGRTSFTGTLSPQDEVALGADEHPKLLKAFGGEYDSANLKRYVDNVGKRLTAHTEYEYPYRFTLLNSPIVNAFALPGGNVYITRGLLALASNEAEMAGVLAHELGHVNARHSAERYGAQQAATLGIGGARLLAGLFLDLPSGMLDTGTQLVQGVTSVALQSYSRRQEFEADMLGVRYMSKVGYDPDGMVSFLSTLREQSILEARDRGLPPGTVDQHNMMSTHPRTIDRVQAAMAEAGQARPARPLVNRSGYLNEIDGMLYGDDPDQGLVQGERFVHRALRFEFAVPPGFRINNLPDRVQATNGQGAAVIFDIGALGQSRDLRAYVTNEWARGAQLRSLETIQVNGTPAATAATVAQVEGGQADARLVAIQRDEGSVYRLLFVSPPRQTRDLDEAFRRTAYSFRNLSESEAEDIKPLRLRIVKAQSQSVNELSKRLPYGKSNPEWFRVMNDMQPTDAIQPTQIAKLVS